MKIVQQFVAFALVAIMLSGCAAAIQSASLGRACASQSANAPQTGLEGSWLGRIEGRNDEFPPDNKLRSFERWRYFYIKKNADGSYQGVATYFLDPGEFPLRIEKQDGRFHIEYTETSVTRILDLDQTSGRLQGIVKSYNPLSILHWEGGAEFCKMSDNSAR